MNFTQFANAVSAPAATDASVEAIKADVFITEQVTVSDYDASGAVQAGKNIVVYLNEEISPFVWMAIYRNPIATRSNGKSPDAGAVVVNWNKSPWSARVALSALSHLAMYQYEISAHCVEQIGGLVALDLSKAEIEWGTPNLLTVGEQVVPFYVPSPKVEEDLKAKHALLKKAKGETWVILSRFGGIFRFDEYANAYRSAMYSLLEKLHAGKDIMIKGLDSKIPAYALGATPTDEQKKFVYNGWFYDAAPYTSKVLNTMSLATPEERIAAYNGIMKERRQELAQKGEQRVAKHALTQAGKLTDEQTAKIEGMVLAINPVWAATDVMWLGGLKAAGVLTDDGKGIVLSALKAKITLKKYNAVTNVPHSLNSKVEIDPTELSADAAAFLLSFNEKQVNFSVVQFDPGA